jgi:hypothetical protein
LEYPLHEPVPGEEPIGVVPAPQEVEHKVQRSIRLMWIIVGVSCVLALLLTGTSVAITFFRGQENQAILRNQAAENSPESAAVSNAYLNLFRFQIDCDGRHREQESDNALVLKVSQFVPGLVGSEPIDLADGAESCKSIPAAEKALADAVKKMNEVRQAARRH